MIHVVIVEDVENIRTGLKYLIDGTPGFTCSGNFDSCEELLDRILNMSVDVILMDIDLKGISGIEGMKKIKKIRPEIDIIMLTVYDDNEKIFEALCSGACGYLTKQSSPAKIVEAIHEVKEGGSPMSASIARKVVTIFQKQNTITKSDTEELTNREKEVLTGLINGNSYQSIADQLFVSLSTVRFHIKNIYQKLHVKSQTEAVSKALRERLI